MNSLRKSIGYFGIALSTVVFTGTLVILFFSSKPPQGAQYFEGFTTEGSTLVMREGSLELVEGGVLQTSKPPVWHLRNLALGSYALFTLIASLLLVNQPRSKEKEEPSESNSIVGQ